MSNYTLPAIDDINSLPFKINVNIYEGDKEPSLYQARWSDSLDGGGGGPVVVLNEYEDQNRPGLYYKKDNLQWVLAIEYDFIPDYIVNGGEVDIYYNVASVPQVPSGSQIFSNGTPEQGNSIPQKSNDVWAALYIVPTRNYGTTYVDMGITPPSGQENVTFLTPEQSRYQNLTLINRPRSDALLVLPDDKQTYTIVVSDAALSNGSSVYIITRSQYDSAKKIDEYALAIFLLSGQSCNVTVFGQRIQGFKPALLTITGSNYINSVYNIDVSKALYYLPPAYSPVGGYSTVRFFGSLPQDSDITVYNTGRLSIINDCTGGYALTLRTPSDEVVKLTMTDGDRAEVAIYSDPADNILKMCVLSYPVSPDVRKSQYASYSGDDIVRHDVTDIADGDIFALGGGSKDLGGKGSANFTSTIPAVKMQSLQDGARFVVNNRHPSAWGSVYFNFSPEDNVDVMFNEKLGGAGNRVLIPGQSAVTFQWSEKKWLCWESQ